MSNYTGIIFAVIGLFSTTVLFSICMSCYKCFMKRRKKRLASKHKLEVERIGGDLSAPPATTNNAPATTRSIRSSNARSSGSHNPSNKRHSGKRYPAVTGPTLIHHVASPIPKLPENVVMHTASPTLKRHSMYYSVESMDSLNSAVEGPP